jgi:iron complex outermembrane receptor protein
MIGATQGTRALTLAVASVVAVISGASAHAQEAMEEVTVTGSRIARDPNLGAPVPIQAVSGEDIALSGELDPVDVINDVPALLTSVSSDQSIDGVFATSVGQSVLQLRALGADRTLVLVNGKRHVSGVAGAQSVDIGSIPSGLIERVEVLTGGASAVYGADAVTGVVNFIMKDDFEGLDIRVSGGASDGFDGGRLDGSITYGFNFGGGKGNIAASVDFSRSDQLTAGSRPWSRNNGIADDLPNPALRFQEGDLGANTPNFDGFITGDRIPSLEDFDGVDLTQDELALINQAENAPLRAILPQPTFSISSNRGVIVPAVIDGKDLFDFGDPPIFPDNLPGIDTDGNGIDDCLDSRVGFNSQFAFGGCYVVNDDGSVRPYRDGLIATDFNQFGGDGIANGFDQDYIVPSQEGVSVNLQGKYEFAPAFEVFGEAKYVTREVQFGGPLNTFYDLLTVASDNPYIPDELLEIIDNEGIAPGDPALYVTRDPTDLGPNINTNERETQRFVGGIRGDIGANMNYEIAANYGKFTQTNNDANRVIMDRFFAAIDVTTDENGNPICRSELDGSRAPTTPFGIPLFDFGFFTFNPGDGQCVPANILGGPNSISAEAVDFITTTTVNQFELEQTVFSGVLAGQTPFELPGGGIGWAVGAEWREEKSTSTFDPLVRGVQPIDTVDGNAGDLISDNDDFAQNSLVFDPAALIQNSGGQYDVWDVFAEVSLPLISDRPFARELTVDAAVRLSEYSTIGSTTTFRYGGSWAPINSLRFRGAFSRAVRAPNINELFDPEQGAFFRPFDPCDQANIDGLLLDDPQVGQTVEANCRADGIPEGYTDPLSARFVGVTSGNPDLKEETADTITFGFVVSPEATPGLTVSIDYWDIDIADAIAAVSAQDIVDNCYGSGNFPNQFCDLFSRNRDPLSPQFNGFNFLRQTEVNFGKIEASGVDFSANYAFDVGNNAINVGVSGTWTDKANFFFDPGDPTAVDRELRELQRPEWAGNLSLAMSNGPFSLNWNTQFVGSMGLRAVEIDTAGFTFGDAGIVSSTLIHNLRGGYLINDRFQVFAGINNVTGVDPFITETNYPVGARGRYLFVGLSANLL